MSMPLRSSTAPRYVETRHARPGALLLLFCFPHAGGSEGVFATWTELLPEHVDVLPILLPGHGRRMNEPCVIDLVGLAETIGDHLIDALDRPFVFYGHSMGALLAFETARWLRQAHGTLPRLLIAAASPAPQLHPYGPATRDMTDTEFRDELRRLSGTPEPLLNDDESMRLMLPVLRADFRMAETYTYTAAPPLRCPITAIGGARDDVTAAQLEMWRTQTADRFALRMLDGDHFFNGAREALMATLARELRCVWL